jgi:hydrogenase expression/formation protein HypC
MCLAIPGQVVDIEASGDPLFGTVSLAGVTRRVCLDYLPDVRVGDYVLIHVGFALSVLDEDEARRRFELLRELEQMLAGEAEHEG